ncbi:hypothetical protein ACH5RR_008508 [Cinchona calisaya]|uniref:Uncharacterized protein n=1 Tax=Cinchona calisaya TaxID=153742 RepID=A0ABD3ABK1_9GENT
MDIDLRWIRVSNTILGVEAALVASVHIQIRKQDLEIRELKRKLMVAEERVLGKAELSNKIKLILNELQDNMVLKITEAEENMELRLMNIELRIQELNDHLNPPAQEDPEEVLEIEEEVDVEDN